jgi:hypothetical protein
MGFPKTIRFSQTEQISRWVFLAGLAAGLAFFAYYYAHGLTLAHYDAKAHLVVARRMVDSVEPGYAQMGVNWLPLIHLLYLPFVIFDSQYRSGVLPSLISVCAFALSAWLAYRISCRVTGSIAAGVFAAIVLLANPNFEYLQSCPLTEPLYMALSLLALDCLITWRESDHSRLPWAAAIWAALGALCRYEGWYFLAGVLLLLSWDFWKNYMPRRRAMQAGVVYLAAFGVPAAVHFGYIFLRLGDNFFYRVAAGHPDPYMTYRRPVLSLVYHLAELSQVAAIMPLFLAAAGLLLFLSRRKEFRSQVPLMLLWLPSLINISALYWGLIYRVRYSVLVLPAVAVFGSLVIASIKARKLALPLISVAVMVLPWFSWYFTRGTPGDVFLPGPGALLLPVAALLLFLIARSRQKCAGALIALCVLGMQLPPLNREYHPMMAETLEHDFIEPQKKIVLEYLRQNYDGRRILIDMGKLAPLVYDSRLAVKEFVYNEGGEVLWHEALKNPKQQVGWLCSQKGDAVWERLQVDPNWAGEYALAVKTEYFSLYRLRR